MRGESKPPVRLPKELLRAWLLLLLEMEPNYGYEMRCELLGRGIRAEPSSVYRALRQMEEQGLVASHWADDSDGPRRRIYALTAQGNEELEQAAAAFSGTRNVQSAFLRAYRANSR